MGGGATAAVLTLDTAIDDSVKATERGVAIIIIITGDHS